MGRKKLLPNRANLILQAASQLFEEFSYEKTTLDEIAERAGVSKGSIYLEFESKEAILFAMIWQAKEAQLVEMRQMLSQKSLQKSKSRLETLKAMLVKNMGAIYEAVKRNRRSPEEMIHSGERLRARLKPFFDARLQLIETLLQQASQAGEIKPLKDYHRTAQLIMLTLRAVLPPYDPTTNKLKIQNETAEILELIFNGLR